MLIERIGVTPLAVPLAAPYHWRYGADATAYLCLIQIEGENGLSGYGESICIQPAATEAYLRELSEFFVGRHVHEFAPIRQAIWESGRWSVTPRLVNQSLAGLEAACWDLWGKTLDLPVSDLLGGRIRDEVDFFGFIQGDGPAALHESATNLRRDGFSTFYVKVGRGRTQDTEAVATVRAAIEPHSQLRVDANEAWDTPTAIAMIRTLDEYELDWVEQPVRGDDVDGLATVRRRSRPAIAADNAVYSRGELRAVLIGEAADAIVLSPHEVGGLLQWQQSSFLADAFGIPLNRKAYLESDISTLAALQVMATVPNLTEGNQITHQLLDRPLTRTPLRLHSGKLPIPTAAGLGITIDEDAVADARACYQAPLRDHPQRRRVRARNR